MEQDRKFSNTLLKISKLSAIDAGDLESSYKAITEAISSCLDVARAGIWLYNDDETAIHCVALYEAKNQKHSDGLVLKAKDFPMYFKYLSGCCQISCVNSSSESQGRDPFKVIG